jgi:hypothetical protein
MSALHGARVAQQRYFPTLTHELAPAYVHLAWFAGGVVIGFLTPFIFSSVLELHHDLYYLVYFTITLTFLASYVRATRIDLAELFSRAWRWSVALGLVSTAFVVANVLSRESTPGPTGLYAGFEVLWRGVAYGTVDALLLTAFPGVVALGVIGDKLVGLRRHLLFAAVMLPLVLVITGAYHLGYEQFREDGVAAPEFGNTVISVPMLATGNPLGSIVSHASMHVAADLHAYETEVFLPPETEAP